MLFRITFFVFILTLCLQLNLTAQQTIEDAVLEEIIENYAADAGEDADYNEFYEQLLSLAQSPLNINNCTRDELRQLFFLSAYQIDNLLAYREEYGSIYSAYELLLIDGFLKSDVMNLQHFLVFDRKKRKTQSLLKMLQYGTHEYIARFQLVPENQKGYIPNSESGEKSYLGNRLKIYNRYAIRYGKDLHIGFTAEKDAGEQFFNDNQKYGFDFYSAHIEIANRNILKKLIIGDYSPRFGQGLTLWQGFGSRKTASVLNVEKRRSGLSRYTSTDENNFMRGIAATIEFGHLDFSAFLSHKTVDANIENDNGIYQIISLPNTGLHTTDSQIEKKDAAQQSAAGFNAGFGRKNFYAGITITAMRYNLPIAASEDVYNQFRWQGKSFLYTGIDYRYGISGFGFFGETTTSNNGALATLNGLRYTPLSRASMVVLHRMYQPEFYPLLSAAFAENTNPTNEHGLYFGLEIFPAKYLKMSMYADVFKSKWLKYLVNAPSEGEEYLWQAEYEFSSRWNVYARIKYERKAHNTETTLPVKYITETGKRYIRFQSSFIVSSSFEIRNRIEFSHYSESGNTENGLLIYQDLIYAHQQLPLKLAFRYAVFDTPSYDTRIYAYENDVLHSFSVPAYSSKGIRTYLLLKYKVGKVMDLQFRYAISVYSSKEVIGSGYNEIDGNRKSELKMLLKVKF